MNRIFGLFVFKLIEKFLSLWSPAYIDLTTKRSIFSIVHVLYGRHIAASSQLNASQSEGIFHFIFV